MALSDEQQTESGFGLRFFKTSQEARKKDVPAALASDDPYAAFRDQPSAASAAAEDPYAAFREAPSAARTAPASSSDFARGFGVARKQLKQTAYGAAALIGDTLGAEGVKSWGLKGYKEAEQEIQEVSKPSDSFTTALEQGGGAVVDWLQYAGGYLTGQALELGASALAGAAIGGAVSGPAAPAGATAGAITGAVNKAAVQTGIRGVVSKMIDKEAARRVANGVAAEVAAQQAVKSVYRTIGATTANTFLNATQELGSIYGEAVEQAAKTGEEYSLGKIWLAGVAATAVDTWADSRAVKGLTDAFKGTNRVSSIAVEAFKGGLREGLTEGTQTVIERWGADKDLATKEAFKEYIDSAAIGVLGGTVTGATSGAVSKLQTPGEERPADPNITRLKTPEERRSAPVDIDGQMLQMREDVEATLSRPDLMAAMYLRGDEAQRQTILRSIQRSGFINEFNAALQNPAALESQSKILDEYPALLPNMVSGLDMFANTLPDRTFKVDKRTTGGTLADEDAAADAAAAQGTSPTPPVVEEPDDPSVAPTTGLPERTGPQGEERNPLIQRFNEIGVQIFGMNPGSVQDAKFDWAMNQLVKTHGFSTADARAILTGELVPEGGSAPSQGKPNLDDQGALDEAVDNAQDQANTADDAPLDLNSEKDIKRAGGTVVPLDELARNGDSAMSPWLLADGRVVNTGQDHIAFAGAFVPGDYSTFMRKTGAVRAGMFEDRVTGDYVVTLHLAEGQQLTPDQISALTELQAKVGRPIQFLVGRADGMVNPEFEPATLEQISGQPASTAGDTSTPPTPPSDVNKAKEDLKNAAANLFDVLTDATGSKLNITGQRYTVADIPPALIKVMEAVAKLGYVKFKDVVRETMKRMRENKTGWAELADKVTPFMLRQAYNAAKIEGKEDISGTSPSAVQALIGGKKDEGGRVENVPMYYKMEPGAVREGLREKYSQGTSTAELIKDGVRTATTRLPFAKVGDTITFKGDPTEYRVTAVEKPDLKTEEGRAKWEQREGWSLDYIDANPKLKAQVYSPNVMQTVFEPINKPAEKPAGGQDPYTSIRSQTRAIKTKSGEDRVITNQNPISARTFYVPPEGAALDDDPVSEDTAKTTYRKKDKDAASSEESLRLARAKEDFADFDPLADPDKPPYEGAKKRNGNWVSRDGNFTAYPTGGYGARVVSNRTAEFLDKHGFGNSHLNLLAIQILEALEGGRSIADYEARLVAELADLGVEDARGKAADFVRQARRQAGKAAPLPISELTPNMKRLLSMMDAKAQKQQMNEWGRLSPDGLQREKDRIDGAAERADKRALERLNETPRVREFKLKVNKLLSLFNDRAEMRGLVTALNQRIKEIDDRLNEMRYVNDGNTRFEAISEEDENAYLWGDRGFRIPKETSVERLLALRRSVMEDLREARTNSVRGGAALVRRNIRRIELELGQAHQEAVKDLPQRTDFKSLAEAMAPRNDERSQINAIYDEARRSVVAIMAGMDRPAKTDGTVGVVEQSAEVAEPIDDTFDADTAAYGILRDLIQKKIKPEEALAFFSRGMREGLFTVDDILRNADAAGFSISGDMISQSTNLSLTRRMLDYTKSQGYSPLSRYQWLNAMHNMVGKLPGGVRGPSYESIYTAAERAAYEEWLEAKQNLAMRRKEDPVMMTSADPRNAFRGMLFIDYRLFQMRNPDLIEDARARMMLQGTIDNLPDAWHADLFSALKRRPDLRQALYENELTDAEIEAHNEWLERRKAAVAKDAEIAARTPFFLELANLDAAMPLTRGASQDALERAQRGEDETTRGQLYETMFRALARAKQDQLDTVMAHARELYQMAREQASGSKEFDDTIDWYLEFFSAQDESLGGVSMEEFAAAYNEGKPDDVEGMSGPALSDEFDGEVDVDPGFDEDGNMQELRFRRGPYSGAVSTMNVVAEVADITSTWPNAPHIEVVQNVTQLPEGVREKVMARMSGEMGAKGVYVDGVVYLFSDHLTGRADVEFTLYHEAYGHLGMRAFLGNKFDSFLETAYRTRPEVKKAADALIAQGMAKLEAIDEVLSDMAAENRNVSVVKQWVGKIIAGLREMGFTQVADWLGSMTDAEVAAVLKSSRDAARNGLKPPINGAPSEVRFKLGRMPYEIFSNKGGNSTAYARYNPSTDTWVVFTATGASLKDGHTAFATQSYEDVLRAMRASGKVEYRTRSGVFVDDKIVADLVSIPKFNDQGKYSVLDKRFWSKLRRNAQTQFQNEYLPVFEVVDYLASVGRLTDQIDVKTALTLYERRTGYMVEQFRKRYVQPITKLIEQAGKLGVTKRDIDRYLTARHTEERNRAVAKINPGMPDGGSGLTYEDAEKIIRQVQQSPAARVLDEIARLTDMMGKEKISYLHSTGMITRAAMEKLIQYDHYVNLSGEKDTEADFDDPGQLAGGSKFNVKGKEKRAFGRGAGNEATDVLARTIQAYEAAIIRGQKNLVAQKILALIETNYDSAFAIVNAQSRRRQLNPETGLVEEVVDENYIARKDVMVAKVDGIPVTIEFKDNTRGSFAEAIHGMVSPPASGPIMEAVGKVTRMLGALLTTYNPAFVFVNFFRDVQTMYLNAASDGKITKKMARDMIKVLPKAITAAMHEASDGRFGKGADPEMLRVLREMQRSGGITYFADRRNLEEQVQKIDDLLSGKQYPGQKTAEKVLGVLEFLANVSEIAPRLAAYRVVSDNGFSRDQAATFSGEITVNFNMRGANKEMRQLFLFFNPAVQGSYKMWKLWSDPKGRAQFYKMAAALTAFGFLTSLLGRALSGEDDDGIDKLDKVPVYKRATSVVLLTDTPFGAPLPIPYGWNAFFATGVFMADTVIGKQPMRVTAERIAKTTAEAFSPIGMGASDAKSFETFLAKFAAPTLLLPGVEFLANENRFGAPIRKQDSAFSERKTPDAQSYFRGVSPVSRAITDSLTELTGGNKYKAGAIDVNPATIDFLVQSFLPGLPSDLYKGASVGIRAAQGEEIKRAPWPVLDRFSARIPTGYDAGAYRRAAEMVETVYAEYSKTRDQERRREIREEYPRIGYAHASIASTKQQLRDVRSQIEALEQRPMSDEARVERRNQLMAREEQIFKRAVKRLMEAGEPVREAMMANE